MIARIVVTLLLLFIALTSSMPTMADNKFSVSPTGRLFIDGAAFVNSDKDLFRNGVAIPEIWLGASMSYGKWIANINLAFNNNKVNLRAIYMGYHAGNQLHLRFGSFLPQFGLRTTLSSSNLAPMIPPMVSTAFNDGRQLAAMAVYYPHDFLAALTVHTMGETVTAAVGQRDFSSEGVGFSNRLVYRPIRDAGKVVQAGISSGYVTPRQQNDDSTSAPDKSFQLKANYPTNVVKVNALDAIVTNAVGKWRFSPELLLNYKFLSLESQYYLTSVRRSDGLPKFRGQGAYVILRGLLKGNSYSYANYAGVLDTPAPKSLECVLDYDYTDLSDHNAGILGGRANNFSLTFNYYINRYMIARLRYGHTHTWDSTLHSPQTMNSVMARLQVIF